MKQSFSNGNKNDNRDIDIEIQNGAISFYFTKQYNRQKQWVEDEIENRGYDDLGEDEKANNPFYSILSRHWVEDKTNRLDRGDNFHNHMREKNWFTKDMEDFLNENTK